MDEKDNPYSSPHASIPSIIIAGDAIVLPLGYWVTWGTFLLTSLAMLITHVAALGLLGISASIVSLIFGILYVRRLRKVDRIELVQNLQNGSVVFAVWSFALGVLLTLAGLVAFAVCCIPLSIFAGIGIHSSNSIPQYVIAGILGISGFAGIAVAWLWLFPFLPTEKKPGTDAIPQQVETKHSDDL